jgi:hypothetical protein
MNPEAPHCRQRPSRLSPTGVAQGAPRRPPYRRIATVDVEGVPIHGAQGARSLSVLLLARTAVGGHRRAKEIRSQRRLSCHPR